MQNKRRFVVFAIFVLCMFFLMTFAGGANNDAIATRDVEFVDGFDNSTISLQKVEVGKDAEVPEDPKHENYVFAGWFLFEDHDIRVTDFEEIMEDLKVIALYAGDLNNNGIADEDDEYFKVTFVDSLTNAIIDEQEVLVGLDASAPTAPVHNGYTFTGWSRGYTNVQSDITVNALYRNIPVTTYQVTFIDGDTDEVIEVQTIEEGKTATLPVAPKHTDRVFDHWEGDYTNITANTTITAVYKDDKNNDGTADDTQAHYTVTYKDYDGTELEVFEDVLVDLATPTIEEPTRKYYKFTGWDPEVAETVTDNATYTATYAPINDKNNDGIADEEQNTYTVTYKDYDGTILAEEKVLEKLATPTIANPTREGYVFAGWDPEVAETVTANAEYTATYKVDANKDGTPDEEQDKFTVIYVDYNDTVIETFKDQVINIETPIIANPTRTYYEFTGWNPAVAEKVTKDVTYKATYKPLTDENNNGIADEEEDKFTVTYVDYNDTVIEKFENQVVNKVTPIITNPTRTYYEFTGWTPEVAEKVTANATYKATYKPINDADKDGIADEEENKYTVIYKLDKDAEETYKTYSNLVDGIETPLPANPDIEYAVFEKWNPEVAKTVTADATYYATWLTDENDDNIPDSEQDMFTVVYKDYDDTVLATFENQVVNIATPTIKEPTRTYYEFTGWDPEVAEKVTVSVAYKATYKPLTDENKDGIADEEQNTYTVTYKDYDGTVLAEEKVLEKLATPTIANPTREGYVFAGWNPEVAETVTANAEYTATYKVDANKDGIADEEQDKFTITYVDYNDTVIETFKDQVVNIATPTIKEPTRTYYEFAGWDPEVAETVTANATYKATYTPINDENKDGIADEEQEKFAITYVDYNDTVIETFKDQVVNIATPTIKEPTRTYYEFAGWDPEVAEKVTANATYKATYTPINDENKDGIADEEQNTYTVTYKDYDGTVLAEEKVLEKLATPTITNPTREGYVFAGWNPEVAETVTADAEYTATYKVDANKDGKPDEEQDMFTVVYKDYDDTVLATFENQVVNIATPTIANPTRTYYEFTGWDPEVAETVTETVAYKATYKPLTDENNNGIADEEEDKFTVTYVDYNDTVIEKFENQVVNKVTPTIEEPTRTYYEFAGWDPEVAEKVTANATYKATYKPINDVDKDGIADEEENKYTVIYKLDKDAEDAYKTYPNLVDGIETPLPATPDIEYGVFEKWNPEVAKTVTADATYYATWYDDKNNDNIADKDQDLFTVTYMNGTAEFAKYEYVLKGNTTPIPTATPVKNTYYTFDKWTPEIAKTVTENVTYEAVFKPINDENKDGIADEEQNTYTVIYKDYDGTVLAEEKVLEKLATPTIANPAREGYVFAGWNPEVAETVTADAEYTATYKVDANKDGTPDEEQDMFTVVYKDYDDTVLATFENQVVNKVTPTIADPTRTYYEFTGWDPEVAEKVTVSVAYKATYKPLTDENKDGIADEEQNTYTVTYKDYDGAVLAEEKVLEKLATPTIANPTREGYVFAGWNPEVAKTVIADAEYTATYKVDANKDGIADEEQDKFTITYVDYNDTVIETFKDQVVNIATPTIANPTRTYYEFAGWDPEVAETVTADATYKATYTPINDTNKDGVADELQKRIIFKDYDGTELFNNLVTIGENVEDYIPTVPTRNYYTFAGWTPKVEGTVIEDKTYTATYTPVNDTNNDEVADEEQRRVIFQNYDGTELLNKLVTIGEATPVPETNPTRNQYYEFAGWNPKVAATVTENVTYTATYNALNDKNGDNVADEEQTLWEVRFFGFGGATQLGDVQYVVDGEAAVAPEAPYVSGYRFDGWLEDFSIVKSNLNVIANYTDVEAPYINPLVTAYNDNLNANIKVTVTDNVGVTEVRYATGNLSADDYDIATVLTGTNGVYEVNGISSNGVYTFFAKDAAGNIAVVPVEVSVIESGEGSFTGIGGTVTMGGISGFVIGDDYLREISITPNPGYTIVEAKVYHSKATFGIFGTRYATIDEFRNNTITTESIMDYIATGDNPETKDVVEQAGSLYYKLTSPTSDRYTIYVKYAYQVETAPEVWETRYTDAIYTTRLAQIIGD